MVRNEFPTLRTFARNDGSFMQIERLDLKKEEEVWNESTFAATSLIHVSSSRRERMLASTRLSPNKKVRSF